MKLLPNYIKIQKALKLIMLCSFLFVLIPDKAFGQRAKRNGGNDKVKIEATLPEAEVVARLSVSALEREPLKIQIDLLNPSGKRASVSVHNQQNHYLYNESFSEKEYHRAFNLSQLSSGIYSFKFTGHKSYSLRPFIIKFNMDRDVVLSAPEQLANSKLESRIYKYDPNKLVLHVNNPKNDLVKVSITDKNRRIIHQEYLRGVQIAEVFNTKFMEDGKYTMIVKMNGNTLSNNFEVISSENRTFAWLDKKGREISPTYTIAPPAKSEQRIAVQVLNK